MRRGEIWTVTPANHPKPRPAVILSVDPWNQRAPDVIVIPLTTHPGPSRPEVGHPALRQVSYAKVGSIAAIPKECLKERLGQLSKEPMNRIVIELRRVLGF
jgi:mRNA-degrading endonuclease toxin of MazEF toxin-antitoxin module